MNLYASLKHRLPDVYENSFQWQVRSLSLQEHQVYFSYISNNPADVEKNGKKNNRDYNVTKIKLPTIAGNSIPANVKVQFNLIKSIELDTQTLLTGLDMARIDLTEMLVEEIIYANNDN